MLIKRMNKMLLLGATLSAVFSASVFAQATVEQVMAEGEKRADAGAAEQRRIEQIADQTANLLNDYNTVAKVVDGLVTYNALLQRQIDNQEQEMAALEESIKNVALIERQIIPMMTRMLDSLEVFIDLDTPFLIEERHERLERLRGMMERSDVSAAEKFRRVVEAFQIENDYGRTIEAYKHAVTVDGKEVEADFLRVGRISLAYQTVGGGTTGAWDKDAGQFVKLDDAEFKNQVTHGLRVARKQVAPDLLVVPVFAPEGE